MPKTAHLRSNLDVEVVVRRESSPLPRVSAARIREAVLATLQDRTGPQPASVSILLTTDAKIAAQNKKFREIASPTDVLSFVSDEIDPETGRLLLGDLVISLPRARRQAKQAGHSLEREVLLLVVHGVLHLVGFDHDTSRRQTVMWQAQETILRSLFPGKASH